MADSVSSNLTGRTTSPLDDTSRLLLQAEWHVLDRDRDPLAPVLVPAGVCRRLRVAVRAEKPEVQAHTYLRPALISPFLSRLPFARGEPTGISLRISSAGRGSGNVRFLRHPWPVK